MTKYLGSTNKKNRWPFKGKKEKKSTEDQRKEKTCVQGYDVTVMLGKMEIKSFYDL